ncbi:hypothetical protein DEALK_08520 [Dehalogenimonas alkenigignens]|uniref:Uncharacterized protein n=1 Tax=Dehalogenimonas alkenigignens TaxID=1217799 RepID=A0A0W0GHH4_9CHLR|nr:hypothetical protein [Dehalogenimonas alkenigignens]KTB48007.1 hypothetical protein DEALK_08520 [Dehalogenimonas alkenigignens]
MAIIRESENSITFSYPLWIKIQEFGLVALFLVGAYFIFGEARGISVRPIAIVLAVLGFSIYSLLRALETIEVKVQPDLGQVSIRKSVLGYWYSTKKIDTSSIKGIAISRRGQHQVPGVYVLFIDKKSFFIKTEDEKITSSLHSIFSTLPIQTQSDLLSTGSPVVFEESRTVNGKPVGKTRKQGKIINFDKHRGYEVELEGKHKGERLWLNEDFRQPKSESFSIKVTTPGLKILKKSDGKLDKLPVGADIDLTISSSQPAGTDTPTKVHGKIIRFDEHRGYEIELEGAGGKTAWLPSDPAAWPAAISSLAIDLQTPTY